MLNSVASRKVYYRCATKGKLYALQVSDRAPTLSNETLLCDVQVEHVQSVVDRLDLAHFDVPDLDVLGGRHQDSVSMVLGLSQHLQGNKHLVMP